MCFLTFKKNATLLYGKKNVVSMQSQGSLLLNDIEFNLLLNLGHFSYSLSIILWENSSYLNILKENKISH